MRREQEAATAFEVAKLHDRFSSASEPKGGRCIGAAAMRQCMPRSQQAQPVQES
jgi:hypothetical protein